MTYNIRTYVNMIVTAAETADNDALANSNNEIDTLKEIDLFSTSLIHEGIAPNHQDARRYLAWMNSLTETPNSLNIQDISEIKNRVNTMSDLALRRSLETFFMSSIKDHLEQCERIEIANNQAYRTREQPLDAKILSDEILDSYGEIPAVDRYIEGISSLSMTIYYHDENGQIGDYLKQNQCDARGKRTYLDNLTSQLISVARHPIDTMNVEDILD
jgi:hypothetical protein